MTSMSDLIKSNVITIQHFLISALFLEIWPMAKLKRFQFLRSLRVAAPTFSAIKHKDGERVVSLYSGLKPGGNAVEIVAEIQEHMKGFEALPRGVSIDYTGQIEEQNKQQDFLMGHFLQVLDFLC